MWYVSLEFSDLTVFFIANLFEIEEQIVDGHDVGKHGSDN